ncbi:MAG: TIR domain-containing protein [Solobacterium sp.]|nr:TIR domain-containing protein [Solobacterium sp.]
MSKKYIAFISYRHKPLDKSVAVKLHQAIEHYVIPRGLRKDGRKNLGKVFRDQDELPVSNNLTENIFEALDNSEYLIVICTPDTPESVWVANEITYFLEHHDRNHVLAVLASGAPEESFPEQLTHIRTKDGELVELIEPLAANIVADNPVQRRKLFNREKLRLFAGLLGCQYDELYRREQRYKTRLWLTLSTVVMLVMAGFSGVLLNRNAAIKANYEKALLNQSSYLASESLSALNNSDRFTAISLAIEALPSKENDRPLVSSAEYALGMAVNAYLAPQDTYGLAPYDVFVHSEKINDFTVNEDESRLITASQLNVVTCWDTETVSQKWTYSTGNTSISSIDLVGFNKNQDIIISDSKSFICLETADGNVKWQKKISDYVTDYSTYISAPLMSEDKTVVAAVTSKKVLTFDPGDGHLLASWKLPELPEPLVLQSYGSCLSQDGTKLALYVNGESTSLGIAGVAVMDLTDGSLTELLNEFVYQEMYIDCRFAGTDKLIISYADSSVEHGSNFGDRGLYVTVKNHLQCYDLDTHTVLWEDIHESSVTNYGTTLKYSESVHTVPVVIHSYSNHIDIFEAETGVPVAQAELISPVINVEITRGWVFYMTYDGGFGNFNRDFSNWFYYHAFEEGVEKAIFPAYSAWVIGRSSSTVTRYTAEKADPSWKQYETYWKDDSVKEDFYIEDSYVRNNIVAFVNNNHLLIGNGDLSGKLDHLILPGDNSDYSKRIDYNLFSSKDNVLTMTWKGDQKFGLLNLNTDSLEYETVTWESEDQHLYTIFADDDTGDLYGVTYAVPEEGQYVISVCMLDTGLNISNLREVGTFDKLTSMINYAIDQENIFIVIPDTKEAFRADMKNGSVEKCSERLYELYTLAEELSGYNELDVNGCVKTDYLAFKTAPNVYTITDHDGNDLCTVTGETSEIYDTYFTVDGQYFLILESDGVIRRYRISDGSLCSSIPLSQNVYSSNEVVWREYGDMLAVIVDHRMSLINEGDWGIFAYIPQCFGYLEDQDIFICRQYESSVNVFGSFPRHTTESLIEYGKSLLKGWELSPESKVLYGLE